MMGNVPAVGAGIAEQQDVANAQTVARHIPSQYVIWCAQLAG